MERFTKEEIDIFEKFVSRGMKYYYEAGRYVDFYDVGMSMIDLAKKNILRKGLRRKGYRGQSKIN